MKVKSRIIFCNCHFYFSCYIQPFYLFADSLSGTECLTQAYMT